MTTPQPDRPSPCPRPIDAAVLADYWAAALPANEEDAVEAHLLACDECGSRLRQVLRSRTRSALWHATEPSA